MTNWSDILVQYVWRFRFITLGFAAVLFCLGGMGVQRVTYDPHVLTYFDRISPAFVEFEKTEQLFGRSNEIVFLVKAKQGTVFDPPVFSALQILVRRAADIPGVDAVSSILDIANVEGQTSNAAKRVILQNREKFRDFLSKDAQVTAIAAFVPRKTTGDANVGALAQAARNIATSVRDTFPGLDVLLTGRIIIEDAFQTEGQNNIIGPPGLSLVVTTVVLLIALSSWTATAALLIVILVATTATLGAVGWIGMSLNGISSAAPSVLVGLSVATGVHIVLAWQDALRNGTMREEAVARAVALNAWPVVLSVATTIVSFLCLNLATSPPFRQLGNVVAFGLTITLLLCFTLLPLLLLILPKSLATRRRFFEVIMARLGGFVAGHKVFLAATCAATTSVAIFGISQIIYDDTFSHYFDERYEVRRATDLFEDKLTGTTIISATLATSAAGSANSGDHRAEVAALGQWLIAQPKVVKVATP
ncbi:MAG: MMPL family transporter, partial [Pseudomonadota bacterium]